MDDPVGALHQEAIKAWLAVQAETRGIGIDGAGDLRAPLSHENFERFVYRNFPTILDALARAKARPHPTPAERMSRAMTFDHVTSDEFVTTLREAHQDLDDAMNDLDEAKGALEESDRKNDRLREVLRLVVRTGCGCHPICQCEEPGSLAIWKEEIVSAARSALNAAQDEDSPAQEQS